MTLAALIVASMNRLCGAVRGGLWMVLLLTLTGCGGVSGSHSVSPASLFLPGLMKNEVPPPPAPGAPVRDHQIPGAVLTDVSGTIPS